MGDRATGPLGVDPLHYVCVVFGLLICWVGYLLLPKGMRQQHFNAYPKRFRWSARPRTKRGDSNGVAGKGQVSSMAAASNTFHPSQLLSRQVGWSVSVIFHFFVFQLKNWRIVIGLFSYSHFIRAISQTVQTTIINNRHPVEHRKAITEICLRRALAAAAELLPRLEDMVRSNINHHRPVDNNSSWAAAVRASKTMRSSYRLPCSSFASRAF